MKEEQKMTTLVTNTIIVKVFVTLHWLFPELGRLVVRTV